MSFSSMFAVGKMVRLPVRDGNRSTFEKLGVKWNNEQTKGAFEALGELPYGWSTKSFSTKGSSKSFKILDNNNIPVATVKLKYNCLFKNSAKVDVLSEKFKHKETEVSTVQNELCHEDFGLAVTGSPRSPVAQEHVRLSEQVPIESQQSSTEDVGSAAKSDSRNQVIHYHFKPSGKVPVVSQQSSTDDLIPQSQEKRLVEDGR